MGSYPEQHNLLSYLRSKSQVDCDCLDIQVPEKHGPFADSTSNQADAYLELLLPHRAEILRSSIEIARNELHKHKDVSQEQLAVEVAMCKLSLLIASHVTGSIHVMTNPTLTSTGKIVENAQRLSSLCHQLEPAFDLNRLCIKVVATWEGLQACRKLSNLGINTLATTLFTIEQAILAGEVGCQYIAPFVHELKAFFDTEYDDGGPNLSLCVEAQTYYKSYKYSTRVKAAGLLTLIEAKQLAGVSSMTIAPDLVTILDQTEDDLQEVERESLFVSEEGQAKESGVGGWERRSYLDDEAGFRAAYAKSYDGKGEWKTKEAINIFSEYQRNAEKLMLEKRAAGRT